MNFKNKETTVKKYYIKSIKHNLFLCPLKNIFDKYNYTAF